MTEFERGRIRGLREAIAFHEREEMQAYRDLNSAQERYSETAGEAAQERINWHSDAADHFRRAEENPDYFGPGGGVR